MNDLTGELVRMMAERQVMYQFLARAFRREVDQELLSEMSKMDFSTHSGVTEIDQGFQMLEHFLGEANETTLADLATEYARIFLGAGPRQSGGAFPYESVYTSPRGLLMQEARDQVVEIYRREGLQSPPDFHEPEDHVALELGFMAHLCGKTGLALEGQDIEASVRCIQKQFDFLEEHLCMWAPRLCRDVQHGAACDFYRAVASITMGYLMLDQDLIADLLETLKIQAA